MVAPDAGSAGVDNGYAKNLVAPPRPANSLSRAGWPRIGYGKIFELRDTFRTAGFDNSTIKQYL